jgi:uncharacterized YccA/Bax inhibitor family protein
MRTSNPTLNENIFSSAGALSGGQVMTVQGMVNKTFILLALLLVPAAWIWFKVMQPTDALGYEVPTLVQNNQAAVMPLVIGGGIVGFILALVTVFKKQWSGVTAPLYAVCEGLVLGGISALFEMQYPGIVMQAVALTFGTLFCMLAAYKFGLIRATEKFRTGIIIATGAIGLFYLVVWVLSFFHIAPPGFINGSTPLGIGFSLFVVGIAALNLILDFDLVERGEEVGAPKYMEWYCAFGLMVTLIWLYMEILRLLSKLRSRD